MVIMTSLILLAAIAAAGPGFLYRRFRQWWDREPASIRRVERRPGETAAIALVPITGALWLFAVVRAWCPKRTPDVGAMLRNPNNYLMGQSTVCCILVYSHRPVGVCDRTDDGLLGISIWQQQVDRYK